MSMKINCDKCGYILGGIEVKENYGCNACNPFWKEACGDCGHINGFHLDKCPRSTAILENNIVRGVKVGDGVGVGEFSGGGITVGRTEDVAKPICHLPSFRTPV